MPKTAPPPARKGAKPKLGQHFLTDQSVAARIVEALGDISQSTILEIGPGRGALTSLLARRARRLIAVELDRVLAAQLRMKFALYPNVEIIEADILAVDFDGLFAPKPGSTRPGLEIAPERVRVAANLPYYISSELLLRLFEYRKYFNEFVLMVQKEVGERLAAKPGGSDYGMLSATAQLYARVETLFTVPASAFSPPPKVQSVVVRLAVAPKFEELQVPEAAFIEFLKQSFQLKRKTIWNNLKEKYKPGELRAALEKAKIKPNDRAETLPLQKSAALFRALQHSSN